VAGGERDRRSLVLLVVKAGASNDLVNLGVTALNGGPHTLFSPSPRRTSTRASGARTAWCAARGGGGPGLRRLLGHPRYEILISTFLSWPRCTCCSRTPTFRVYRRRAGRPEPRWSRWVDYGLLMTSIYPLAAYKLVRGEFSLGSTRIVIPELLLVPATYYAVFAVFFLLLAAWLLKTAREWQRGALNRPKTLLSR
jgi:hypothetical protein